MRYNIVFLLLAVLLASCSSSQKAEPVQQTVKDIVLKPDSVFEDKLEIPFDDQGVQILVSLSFDENTDEMLLSVAGTRKLFVFRKGTVYKDVFSHPFMGMRTLHPEKLKYPVLVQPNTTYRLPKAVYKGFSSPKKKHVFNEWLTNVSKSLTLVYPTPTGTNSGDIALVNDSVVQRFKVSPDAKRASFTLRNILVADPKHPVDPTGLNVFSKKAQQYQLVCDKDLKLTYNITIQRNPCFDTKAILDSMDVKVKQVVAAYHTLLKSCPTGKASSEQEEGIFRQHRGFLLSQFPKSTQVHDCSDVQSAIDKYNMYVDSISSVPCVYISDKAADNTLKMGCRPEVLLAAAHQIDSNIARILSSHDSMEIRDLRTSCRDIVRVTNNTINERGVINDEQRRALAAYRRAEAYFNQIVGN